MSNNYLKLISLNVEKDQHTDLVCGFLRAENPDVFCAQEITESCFEFFKKEFAMDGIFKPMTKHFSPVNGLEEKSGIAVLSKLEILSKDACYYSNSENQIKFYDSSTLDIMNSTVAKVVIVCKIKVGKDTVAIATTHFTWTPDGMADDQQRKDLCRLLDIVSKHPDIVLCGDLNAPRGFEIFNKIASIYKDNIPLRYDSSIDPVLHRKKGLKFVVDSLFSTKEYLIKNVELKEGVSDHKAIVAYISRV